VPVASDALVSFDQLRRTEFYGELLEPQNIGHGALFMVDDTPERHVGLSFHRSRARGSFASSELMAPAPLLPHMRRAIQLRVLLEQSDQQRRLAVEILDRVVPGILLVDGAGRVMFANRAATDLAATRDAIVLENRSIRARHRAQSHLLQSLIGFAAAGGPGGAMAVTRASGRLPIAALVAPLKGALAFAAAADGVAGVVAIFLTDPNDRPSRRPNIWLPSTASHPPRRGWRCRSRRPARSPAPPRRCTSRRRPCART
jgi:PAS domain-containing protein